MKNTLRVAMVAAAVVVVAFVAYQFLPGSNTGGPGPSPTPTATPVPSPTPTTAAIPDVSFGVLDAGTYRMAAQYGGVAFSFTVPAGWKNDADQFVQKNTDTDSLINTTTGVLFSAWRVDHVFADACQPDGTEEPVDDTVEALAVALANQAGRETSGPVLTELDGYPAQTVELIAPADLNCFGGILRTWPGLYADLNSGLPAGPGQIDTVYIVDVGGTRLVVVATHWAGTSAEDLAELSEVVASIKIE